MMFWVCAETMFLIKHLPHNHLLTLTGSEMFHNRRLEEPLITLLGPAMFKMLRILAYVVVSVHLACCMYYRVKVETSPVSSLELWQHYILVNGI